MQEKTITALCDALTGQQLPFVQGEPLAAHTTFRIGGPAGFWCAPQDAEQLRETLRLCRENGVRVYLLGNGSNTLFDDAGFDGAVVDMRGLSQMEYSDAGTDVVRITAGAGQTRNRHGRVCFQQRPGTGSQMLCRAQRHRAVLRQNLSRHAQNVFLDPVGIADDTALVDLAAAGNLRQRRADAAAGEAFGGDQRFPLKRFQHITAKAHHGTSP